MENNSSNFQIIPHHHRPGTDLLSKTVLKDQYCMKIILSALLGRGDVSHLYVVGDCTWNNNLRSDVLYASYVPKSQKLPPVLVEIQHTVDSAFMRRAVSYCLSVHSQYHMPPVLLIIAVNKLSQAIVKTCSKSTQLPYLREIACGYWAEKAFLLDSCSIAAFTDLEPLDTFVALGLFLTEQKQSLSQFKQKSDPTLCALYKIAHICLQEQCLPEDDKATMMLQTCDQVDEQFLRIKAYCESPERLSKKRLLEAVEDGISCVKSCRANLEKDSKAIEEVDDSLSSHDELEQINKMNKAVQKIEWSKVFKEGRKNGLFKSYKNAETLKSSYYRNKKKHQSK